jgi:hypothetical protein
MQLPNSMKKNPNFLNSYRTSSIARQSQTKPVPKKLKLKYLNGSIINEDSIL